MNKIKQIVKSKFRTGLKTIPYIIIAVLVGITAVYASSTTSLIPSGSASNTMYSLTDIYNLAAGTVVSENEGVIETTPTEITLSGKSLSDVYTAISTEIEKLSASVITTGTTAFGIEGEAETGGGGVVTKTGQTICYDASGSVIACTDGGTALGGQDGYYATTKGTALAYTDNGNATITDTATGLMWKKCSEGKTGNTCATGSNTTKTWTQALSVCEADTTASFTDWRLPNIRELSSLVDYERFSPAINPFFSTESNLYWSSTTYLDDPYFAWFVSFHDGDTNVVDKTYPYYVRCVRG